MSPRNQFACALLLALYACTDPVERPAPLSASIDADGIVRQNTAVVEITLQGQRRKSGGDSESWDSIVQQSFRPESDDKWPWRFTLTAEKSQYERYNLVAIARDARRSIVGRVQVIRELSEARHSGIRGRFDAACFRRDECYEGYTCVGGACVDATSASVEPAADGGTSPLPTDGSAEVPDELTDGIATAGASCKTGQLACADHGSRTPLACEAGSWKAQPDCPEAKRCDTADGDTRGTCQPVTDQCQNRQANVPFCDGEMMRVCPDLVASLVRPCSDNERCVSTQDSAECRCKAGFVMEGDHCTQPSQCGANNGGCDTLTSCSTEGDERVCGTCPAQYTGTGDEGCSPQLLELMLSSGTLDRPFASDVHAYRVHVPLVAQRVSFTPSVPANTMVTVNGGPLDERGTWTSPVLQFGETTVTVEILSKFGVTSQYSFTLERTVEQVAYLKAINPGAFNQFGTRVAISGDTLVVTAWFDDSAAQGIDGDPQDTNAANSGAVYVYVREGDEWNLQSYVKPSDTMAYDYFGSSVDLEGDVLVVGAIHEGLFEGDTGPSRPGAAYVFERTAGVWKQAQRLAVPMQSNSDLYGTVVALSGDTLVVGAPWESTAGSLSGAVYVYQRNGSTFAEVQKLKATMPTANGAFGTHVSVDGNRLVVGAPSAAGPGTAEVFVRDRGTWKSSQVLQQPMLSADASFGGWTALRGNRLAVSAPRPSPFPGSTAETDPGEVYVYELAGETWKQTAVLTAPHPRKTNWFGLATLFTSDGLVIASPGDSSGDHGVHADPALGDAPFSGAVHLFAPSADGWVESAFIKGDNTAVDNWFGSSIAVDDGSLVVGAMFENRMGTSLRTGAVYQFR